MRQSESKDPHLPFVVYQGTASAGPQSARPVPKTKARGEAAPRPPHPARVAGLWRREGSAFRDTRAWPETPIAFSPRSGHQMVAPVVRLGFADPPIAHSPRSGRQMVAPVVRLGALRTPSPIARFSGRKNIASRTAWSPAGGL